MEQCPGCGTYVPDPGACCEPVIEKEPEVAAPFPEGLLERYQKPVVIPATVVPTESPMAEATTVVTEPSKRPLFKKVLVGLAALAGAAALALQGGTLDTIVTAAEQVLTFLAGLM